MIGLLQRVLEASVTIDGQIVAYIESGLLVFVGVERGDDEPVAERLAERLLAYRVFADGTGRMNLSVVDVRGGVLLVPQFTLAADTDRGTRASFTKSAEPGMGREMFDRLVAQSAKRHAPVLTGRFGADMKVALVNDGPVSFLLRVPPTTQHS